MKCIIKQNGLGGGAPRSILQHIKALRYYSFDNIKCITPNTDDQLRSDFEELVDQLIIRDSLVEFVSSRKYIQALKEYLWEYEFVLQEKPDLVIVVGQVNGVLFSNVCKKLGIPLIVYIPGGEIKPHDPCIDRLNDCEVICFSQENADVLKKQINEAHINIISNRIEIQSRFEDIEDHYMIPVSEINVLIVSRLEPSKIKSVYYILNMLSKCAKDDLKIHVRIAGRGSCQEELCAFCESVQTSCFQIEVLGQVHYLTEQFRWAHIIAGKGRSVIEPIMMNRIGCIIGEDGKMEFCNTNSFEHLYHYNFSGRMLLEENPDIRMQEMLQMIRNGQISKACVLESAEMAICQYSTEFLPRKLEKVLNKLPSTIRPHHYVPLLTHYVSLMGKILIHRILYRKE